MADTGTAPKQAGDPLLPMRSPSSIRALARRALPSGESNNCRSACAFPADRAMHGDDVAHAVAAATEAWLDILLMTTAIVLAPYEWGAYLVMGWTQTVGGDRERSTAQPPGASTDDLAALFSFAAP